MNYWNVSDLADVMVYSLPAVIRNTRAIVALLPRYLNGFGRGFPTAAPAGHLGPPVYSTNCSEDPEAIGKAVAETVWHLDKKRGVKLSAMAVLTDKPSWSDRAYLELYFSFYAALRDWYKEDVGSRGELKSLVPLPLFSLDLLLGMEEVVNAFDLWVKGLESMLGSVVQSCSLRDKKELWLIVAEKVVLIIGEKSSAQSISPAMEKLISVLLHVLWKSVFDESKQNVSDVIADFLKRVKDISHVKTGCEQSSEDRIWKVLRQYRYICFTPSENFQGCEADVVIGILQKAFSGMFFLYRNEFFLLANRTKLQLILVLPAGSQEQKDKLKPAYPSIREWRDELGK